MTLGEAKLVGKCVGTIVPGRGLATPQINCIQFIPQDLMAKKVTKLNVKVKIPKKKTKKKSSARKITLFKNPLTRQYYNCLRSPFDESSYGARVPDQYAVDTQTFSVHHNIPCSTDASGNLDLIISPSLGMYAFSSRSSVITGNSWVTMDASGAGQWLGLTPSSLAGKMVNYRIVGMGVRVCSVASMTNAAGRVIIATLPVENWLNNNDSSLNTYACPTDSNKTKQAFFNDWGIAATSGVVDVGSTDQYTNHKAYSMLELAETTVEIEPKIISAQAFNFRKSADNTGSPSATVVSQTTSAGVALTGNTDSLRVDGHETTIITVSGGVASVAVLDVEVIFHLEGVVQPTTTASSGSQASGLVSSNSVMSAIDPIGFLTALAEAAVQPNITTDRKSVV